VHQLPIVARCIKFKPVDINHLEVAMATLAYNCPISQRINHPTSICCFPWVATLQIKPFNVNKNWTLSSNY